MTNVSGTRLALSRISDTGLFEQLATAVLRAAVPSTYGHLAHPGINRAGKPVKSPVDGIGFVTGAYPRHMVIVHHTTFARGGLERKWLHNPAEVSLRTGQNKAAPAGDVVKAIEIAYEERRHAVDLEVTLALTTNTEPDESLIRRTSRLASDHGLNLDIWSASRLADFLDNNPTGQWLRAQHLGITQQLLSENLLLALSQRSLTANAPLVEVAERIERSEVLDSLDHLPRPFGLLVGRSGSGKSMACHQYLQRHVSNGGYGLVLHHDVLAASLLPEVAIDTTLRQLHTSLEANAGVRALSMASTASPILLIVEDISRSGSIALVLDRLLRWANPASNDDVAARWRIVCPVWPDLLSTLNDRQQRDVQACARPIAAFTPDAARSLVIRRSRQFGHSITPLDADTLAGHLGNDPLLIGLHDPETAPDPLNVIRNYVFRSLKRLAGEGSRTATDYLQAFRALGSAMLRRKQIDPTWMDVRAWFSSDHEQLQCLRNVVQHAEILHPREQPDGTELLQFRHDRVRHWILADAVLHEMRQHTLPPDVFAEPFYADVIGAALSDPMAPTIFATRASTEAPLALFFAIQRFGEPQVDIHHDILREARSWLSTATGPQSRAWRTARYAAQVVLAETRSTHASSLISAIGNLSWAGELAALRNGNLQAGIRLCQSLEPGSNAPWRDLAIDHATATYNPPLETQLLNLLSGGSLDPKSASGALRLAGHVGSPVLLAGVAILWNSDASPQDHLEDYLWAAARCTHAAPCEVLSTVCDAWAALSDKPDDHGRSDRNSLAADQVSWAVWKGIPEASLDYLLARSTDEALAWPITYMLRGLDHTKAVRHLATYLANQAREIEARGGLEFPSGLYNHWERSKWEPSIRMSASSREALKSVWFDSAAEKHLRQKAFRLWEMTTDPLDLQVLPEWTTDNVLAQEVLRARLARRDQTAIPALIARIEAADAESDFWWWSARDLWSNDLTKLLDRHLARRASAIPRDWTDQSNLSHMLSDLLVRRDSTTAEELLVNHWSGLRYSADFVHAALYHSTPALTDLVAGAVYDCPDRPKLFRYLTMHMGIHMGGHPGVTRVEQFEALVPYLDYLDEQSLKNLYHHCSERKWYQFRRTYIDPRLRSATGDDIGNDGGFVACLDKGLEHTRTIFIEHTIDRAIENGLTIDAVFGLLEHWLELHRSPRAFEVASEVLSHAGTRKHLAILEAAHDQSEIRDMILKDTKFAVHRRTII